jgi:hypothetical protein
MLAMLGQTVTSSRRRPCLVGGVSCGSGPYFVINMALARASSGDL